ncbi:hypothetical protein F4861DRAFT_137282 [Xylaria intraflava]|nr:hypothetical protein F4861DRAFT_137282 [Xylaria intraflava]
MFLHSGASLHGHEFSKRSAQTVAGPGNLSNPLFRSTFSAAANKASTHPLGLPTPSTVASDLKQSKAYSEPSARTLDHVRADSQESESDAATSYPEEPSEDETSLIVSDTDVSRVPSPVHRKRRPRTRKSTTYILAHPPPKPRTKQRIISIRPNLVLQIQRITSGLRPRPAIDVYPSSSLSRLIMVPMLKRFPPIAGTKRELGIHDIMLVRSEDYTSQPSGSESDHEEDNIMSRDLLAVISPSKTEDKTEIIMADGTVWMATTRSNGNTYAYEFTSDDPLGTPVTARWVRKLNTSASLPTTPTSHSRNSAELHLSESKFTFSFIDPNYRRHPILATLTSTSLSIPETYTAISQPTPQSPQSHNFSSRSSSSGDQSQEDRHIRPVEERQKSFIEISAVWVALRNGWASNFRPPFYTSITSQMEGYLCRRRRSLSISTELPMPLNPEVTGLRMTPQNALRPTNKRPTHTTPRVSFTENPGLAQLEKDDQSVHNKDNRMATFNRRALSGDWNIGLSRSAIDNSLTGSILRGVYVAPKNDPESHQTRASAPPPAPIGRRAVSVYSPLGASSLDTKEFGQVKSIDSPTGVTHKSSWRGDVDEVGSKSRRRKLKSMTNWLRKLSDR